MHFHQQRSAARGSYEAASWTASGSSNIPFGGLRLKKRWDACKVQMVKLFDRMFWSIRGWPGEGQQSPYKLNSIFHPLAFCANVVNEDEES
eukprot:1160034-Pelagomonas_calceolata.AAC.1